MNPIRFVFRACLCAVMLLPFIAMAQPAPNAAEQALAQAISDYEQIIRRIDPITAGSEGDREALRRWPDPRPEFEKQVTEELAAIGKRLDAIDAAQLSPESALNRTLASRAIHLAVEEASFDFSRIAFQND